MTQPIPHTAPVSDALVQAFAAARAAHQITIKPERRMDNLSSFICRCGEEFPAGARTDNDIDAHLAQAYADAGALVTKPAVITENELRDSVASTIDRRPYDDHTRSQIRGLENAIAREIAALLQ